MIRQHKTNGWFVSSDLGKVMLAIHTTAQHEPTRWLHHGGLACKYVGVRVDMRTGDFTVVDAKGGRLSNEALMDMFPMLGEIEVIELPDPVPC